MTLVLIVGGTVALLLFAVVRLARRLGRKTAEAEVAENSVERAKHALEIDEDVARLPDTELDGELREPIRDRVRVGKADTTGNRVRSTLDGRRKTSGRSP